MTPSTRRGLLTAVVVLGILGFAAYGLITSDQNEPIPGVTPAVADYKNATYTLGEKKVPLTNGEYMEEAAPGSSAMYTVEYFGNEVRGDFDDNGTEDVAFILTENGGGTGTFFYAAAVLKSDEGYTPTNTVFLGDRIAPQSTNFMDGMLIFNYGVRKDDEAMTDSPSVGVSKYLKVLGGALVEGAEGVRWRINDSGAFAENKAPLTTIAVEWNGEVRSVGTYEGTCTEIASPELLPDQVAGVQCLFKEAGSEIGLFTENNKKVLKVGVVTPVKGTTTPLRADFKTLFTY